MNRSSRRAVGSSTRDPESPNVVRAVGSTTRSPELPNDPRRMGSLGRRGRRGQQRNLRGGPLTPALRNHLVEVYRRPGYSQLVAQLVSIAREWMTAHPGAQLSWHDTRGVLFTGALQDSYVRAYIAASPDAFSLLEHMDERSGKSASLLQAQYALTYLKVMPL